MIALGEAVNQSPSHSLPTNLDTKYPIIIIDAGHGGEDGGAIGKDNILEKDINLQIAKMLDEMLRSAGYRTIMTRNDDRMLYDRNVDYKGRKKRLDLEARLNIAESQENAIFISIHMNAFPDSQYHGLQVYYSANHPSSVILAEQIQADSKSQLLPDNERKTKPSNGTSYLLDNIDHPSVLIECGFLSNEKECKKLSTTEYQLQLATVFFCSISDFCKNYKNVQKNVPSS
jgi:N-acetylmuramoyl-L-alanine amidase